MAPGSDCIFRERVTIEGTTVVARFGPAKEFQQIAQVRGRIIGCGKGVLIQFTFD